jgi:biotin operon repressor
MENISGSRNFISPDSDRTGIRKSVLETVDALSSPKRIEELAEAIGCSESAARKRIWSARKAGFNINLQQNGLYWLSSEDRLCSRCHKKLAKLNMGPLCFNCQSDV